MSFLTPAFLAGLAAIAIPVLVHLAYRSSGKPTPFPSLHFLRRIPFRTRRRRALRHPLLFALRCAALALLVAAFARPALPGGAAAGPGGEAREVVLLLDRSYSMGYGDRWERAVAGLREAVAGLGPGDRVSLVGFADRAETLVAPSEDPAAVLAALSDLGPGHGTTRYEAGFRIAGRLIRESDRGRREVVLASDFQAAGWPERSPLSLPAGTAVRAVEASDPEPANLLLTGLALARRFESAGADIAVRVSNAGGAPVRGVEVGLRVNGRPAGTRRVDLEARSATTVRFAGVALPEDGARGELRLAAPAGADRLAEDDVLRFHAAPVERLEVRVVEAGRGAADRSLYLRRALGVGGEPPVALERSAEIGTLRPGEPALVVLNDADPGDEAAGRRLAAFVEEGGGLIVALGARSDPAAWPAAARALLPGRVGEVVDRVAAGGARLATVEHGHPAFQPFRGPRTGDLSAARFLRYRRVEPDTAARVAARFDDGAPALLEASVGNGRVLLWTSTLDRSWTDFPIQPVYLPLVRRMAVQAAGWSEMPRFRTVGEPLDVAALVARRSGRGAGGRAGGGAEPGGPESGDGSVAAEWIVASPGGERRSVRTDRGDPIVSLEEPGFWEVRPVDGAVSAIEVAVNPDPAESDLTGLDPEELLAAAGTASAGADGAGEPASEASTGPLGEDDRGGRELWWPVLLLATGLFVAEAALAGRLDARSPVPRLREPAG